jgi:ferrochelatase
MPIPTPQKLAVILFNLGGPSEEAAIRPFLFNFFMDKNIINLPQPLRFFIALWISWSRSRGAAKKAYQPLGGKSPLLENTKAQAAALEKTLQEIHSTARVFVSMRYWHPLAEETTKEVAAFAPDKIILLPLYPQYSTTTTRSSLENWKCAAENIKLAVPMTTISCYPEDPGFISAAAALIGEALKEAPVKPRLLFSAHGLPEKIISAGDPYQRQCEQTAAAIVKKLAINGLDWQLCYQSRIGPLKWIGPSIQEALEKAAADKTGVVVYPLAFVSEHVETLVELDIEYKEQAKQLGIPYFKRVATVGTHPDFITGLRDLVLSATNGVEYFNGE